MSDGELLQFLSTTGSILKMDGTRKAGSLKPGEANRHSPQQSGRRNLIKRTAGEILKIKW